MCFSLLYELLLTAEVVVEDMKGLICVLQMSYYQKPRKLVRHWIEYSGGAVGLALVSGWVVQHSRLGGSDDLDRWFKQAHEDAICFLDERVKQPV